MKVILDEGVPEGLSAYLAGHDVHSVRSLGWKGTKNGRLIALVESVQTDAFITADKSIERQQNFRGRPFATLVLSTNSWPLIQEHAAQITSALDDAEPGTVKHVECGRFTPSRFRNPKA